ncbi:MAG: hypothetical protein J7539_14300 [Niabella sp.]|nr:hypothetical protein [Niabella sp.]
MSEALKAILVKKMEVKHKLEQVRKMAEFTGKDFSRLTDELLDELTMLSKIEQELEKNKKK